MNQAHLQNLQDIQNNFLQKVLAVSQSGTPEGLIELAGQRLSMKYRIIHRKLRLIVKTMNEDDDNLRKQELTAKCNGEAVICESLTKAKGPQHTIH